MAKRALDPTIGAPSDEVRERWVDDFGRVKPRQLEKHFDLTRYLAAGIKRLFSAQGRTDEKLESLSARIEELERWTASSQPTTAQPARSRRRTTKRGPSSGKKTGQPE